MEFHDFTSHWNSLSRRERRAAEESALLNWNNSELEEFFWSYKKEADYKRNLFLDWGYGSARMSHRVGIVLSLETINGISNDEMLYKHLFTLPLYRAYVMDHAQSIAQTRPGGRTLEALDIANRFIRSFALGSTCKHLRRMFVKYCGPLKVPLLLSERVLPYLPDSDKKNMKLVAKKFSSLKKNVKKRPKRNDLK